MAKDRRREPSQTNPNSSDFDLSRRHLLRLGAIAGAGVALPWNAAASTGELNGGLPGHATSSASATEDGPAQALEEVTIAELQAAMGAGTLTSLSLVNQYLARIEALDRQGPSVNSVLEINPAARTIAHQRDRERRQHRLRGPLHGIPILLKGNIDTGDDMQTTAGSLALVGEPAPHDATVAARLRAAGAVILGKANLSEWANFRGFSSTSGWSGQGGQTRNPYILDRNPCGSSSGSAAAVSANFCTVALGTETDGSIVCPASTTGVVGIKPTLGLTSRAGVIPIASSQDVVGPLGRTVADAAAVLGALIGVDPRDPATASSAGHFFTDYTQFLDPDGLQGARIGVMRGSGVTGYSRETDDIFEQALEAMADAGAVLIDPAEIPTHDQLNADQAEIIVLIYEFKRDLNAYLQTRTGVPVTNMADVIEFNLAHQDRELQHFGQEWFELSEAEIFSAAEYTAALERGRRLAGQDGIDAILHSENLEVLVAPTGSPAWPTDLINGDHFVGASSGPAAVAGYPSIAVPAGFAFGLPLGISFMGTAWSEPTLIKIASGFEAAVGARRRPEFRLTIPVDGPAEAARKSLRARADRRQQLLAALGIDGLRAMARRVHGL
jgi:amidase